MKPLLSSCTLLKKNIRSYIVPGIIIGFGGVDNHSISEEELFNIPYSMRQTQDLGQVSGGRPGIFISTANFNKRAADEQMIAVQIMPRNPCPTAFCVDTSLHNSCIFFHMGFSSREEQYMCCTYFAPSKLAC